MSAHVDGVPLWGFRGLYVGAVDGVQLWGFRGCMSAHVDGVLLWGFRGMHVGARRWGSVVSIDGHAKLAWVAEAHVGPESRNNLQTGRASSLASRRSADRHRGGAMSEKAMTMSNNKKINKKS